MVMKKKRKASPPRIQPIRFARLRWRRRYSASSNGAGSTVSGGVSSVMGSANGRRPPRRTEGKDKRPRKRTVAFRAASGHRRPTPVAPPPAPPRRQPAPTDPPTRKHSAGGKG